MKEDIKDFLSGKGVEWEEVSDLRVRQFDLVEAASLML